MPKFFEVIKHFLLDKPKSQKGLTLIELMVVLGVLGVLLSLTAINLTRLIPKANVSSAVDTLIADLKHQQQKSMLGETDAAGDIQSFGVHIDPHQYVLYIGNTYSAVSTTNSVVTLPESVTLSSTFASDNILFDRGSGELNNFVNTNNTISVLDTVTNVQKTIYFNEFGVITDVN